MLNNHTSIETTLGRISWQYVDIGGQRCDVIVKDFYMHQNGSENMAEECKFNELLKNQEIVMDLICTRYEKNCFSMVFWGADADLFTVLREHEEAPVIVRLGWCLQLCRLVCKLHERDIAHMDLSPENVVQKKKTDELRLIDLGAAGKFNPEDEHHINIDKAPRWDKSINGKLSYRHPYATPCVTDNGELRFKPYNAFTADYFALSLIVWLILCNGKVSPYTGYRDKKYLSMMRCGGFGPLLELQMIKYAAYFSHENMLLCMMPYIHSLFHSFHREFSEVKRAFHYLVRALCVYEACLGASRSTLRLPRHVMLRIFAFCGCYVGMPYQPPDKHIHDAQC